MNTETATARMQVLESEVDESFAIGEALYTSGSSIADVVETPRDIRLLPTPVPVGSVIAYNILFALFFLGFSLVLHKLGVRHEARSHLIVGGICLLTLIAFTGITAWQHRHEQSHGPWFVFEKIDRVLHLPRYGASFPVESVDHFQHLSSYSPGQIRDWQRGRLTEINVIVAKDGERLRYGLSTSKVPVPRLAEKIAAAGIAPVVRHSYSRLELRRLMKHRSTEGHER